MDKRITKTENWDEGLPLGNGKTGSIVYGSSPLKITVDRTDLWDTRPNETTLEKGFTFKNLEKLSAQLSIVVIGVCSSNQTPFSFLGINHSEVILFSSLNFNHKSKYG